MTLFLTLDTFALIVLIADVKHAISRWKSPAQLKSIKINDY